MAVTINKTDGTVLTTIQDGAIDTTNSNLTLIGRLYRNYGELVNENFVKLLENFANSSSPTTPIVGQLWYNTSTGVMSVYRSTGFISLAILTTSSAQPNIPRQGDLWFDTSDAQLKMYNGTEWIVVSPQFNSSQTKTGVFVETRRDALNSNHICIVYYQQNSVVAIHCRDAVWIPQTAISGFTNVKPGFNLANVNGQQFVGNASNALNLGNIEASRFLRNDINGTIDGSLTLANDGLIVGEFDDLQVYIDGPDAYIAKPEGKISFLSGLTPVLNLDETIQAKFADGNESTPSITFISDTDSGLFRVDEDIIGIGVNGSTIVEISDGGIFVNGNIQANNFAGILNATSIITNNLQVTGNTILGSNTSNSVQIRASNITIPNGLVFSSADVQFNGRVKLDDILTSVDGLSPITIDPDLYVAGEIESEGSLTVGENLTVDGTINIGGILIGDSNGRLRFNSAVATGYANVGDFTMGSTNGIRSYNSPKMWIAFNGTLAGLAIYDSFNIDFVTRTSTNNYSFTTEYPISSGAMAVIGTNGTLLTTAPSIGATSFSITTTSESTRMAMIVLSQ